VGVVDASGRTKEEDPTRRTVLTQTNKQSIHYKEEKNWSLTALQRK
jgi:hypothetical protein